jgi:prevent-host-death family protein
MYHREGFKMYNTHVRAVRDLRNKYAEISKLVKNHDQVIITNNGKSEAVLISYSDYAKYEDFLHVKRKIEVLVTAKVFGLYFMAALLGWSK